MNTKRKNRRATDSIEHRATGIRVYFFKQQWKNEKSTSLVRNQETFVFVVSVLQRISTIIKALRMMNMELPKPFIIGVSGGPASGKTMVIERIMDRFQAINETRSKQVITISMESFYKELDDDERVSAALGEYNFDHPTAFDFDKMADTITRLEQGHAVTIPHYDYLTSSSDSVLFLEPADVIIVEGILAFYDERIRQKFTMKLFVDADADVRLARRVKRDTVHRSRPLPMVLAQYTNMVKPAFEEFCQPTMKYADVIIPRAGENDVAIDLIVQHIQDFLRSQRGTRHRILSPLTDGKLEIVSLH